MGLQLCGLQVWCWLVSTVLWIMLVERQLDLSSVTARLRVLFMAYHLYGLQRRCGRLVPPAIALVVLCELALPRSMPQVVVLFLLDM
ncbi:hypothetical protein Taro_016030 [Colocasia esculenta]|uniref:Uncharacterized protein n=1 Tax=Colocasia esculenta TaxID=4460 RepID=A0A843UP08_COLES|nr:hypothetical protein [Colocasia esculenta]